ncbi:MAG TPA: plasmid replication, integration and excision activator [Streptosporangiaceae bacterium]
MALRNGSRFAVSMADVFPHGCYLVPDSIAEAQDYDEKTKRRTPSVDKVTGKRVYQSRVVDMDPDLAGRSREVAVKILTDREPVPPTRQPFEPVEFDGLQVTPYVTDRGRMAYSLRASGIKAARPAAQPGKDAA